jgi:hypothetical protein
MYQPYNMLLSFFVACAGATKKILRGFSDPKIYRQVLVKFDMLLYTFHLVIQATMGWHNCHTHHYSTEDGRIIISKGMYHDCLPEEEALDGTGLKLEDLFKKKDDLLLYIHNMGNNWGHERLY